MLVGVEVVPVVEVVLLVGELVVAGVEVVLLFLHAKAINIATVKIEVIVNNFFMNLFVMFHQK